MAKKWIQSAIKHPGALTAKAKAAGMSLAAFEAHPPKGISSVATKRQINLAKTLASMHKRGHGK
jgi:hypothetical protein